jgi:hypothetical protein
MLNLVSQRFGNLLVLSKNGHNKFKQIVWLCQCDCGNTINVSTNLLRRGGTRSCGCFAIETRTKHGMHNDKVYQIWHNMKTRCNSNNKNYGGRQISIYESWNKFENFYSDFGHTYNDSSLTIERIDVNGNYEPSNVTWTTMKQQSMNKRNTKLDDVKISHIKQLSSQGVSYAEIGQQLNIDHSHARRVAIGERC